MTGWKHIIADSGGSKTSWAFCAYDGGVRYVETRGLHPKLALNGTFAWEELAAQLGEVSGTPLYFYGSGCGRETIRQQMTLRLADLGFGEVSVFPDTLAACRATCGHEPGVVAILGTGSVLVEYDGSEITNRIGGYGSLIGDEGSGFHLARLVLRAYLNGELSATDRAAVSAIVGTPYEVMAQLASPSAQEWIAGLARALSELPLETYHTANLDAFLTLYLAQVRGPGKTMNVVGSYGDRYAGLLAGMLAGRGWKMGAVIRTPIQQLTEFHA
jgi:glucosamine kinase